MAWMSAPPGRNDAGQWITLAAAKGFLRADDDTQDSVITGAIATAQSHVEGYTGLRLFNQEVTIRASSFKDLDHLPIGPVRAIISIAYRDTAGAITAIDPDDYELIGGVDGELEASIAPTFGKAWPVARSARDAVRVTLSVGYDDQAALPAALSRALFLLLGEYYSFREDTLAERSVTPATLPNGVDALLTNWRI